MKCPKCEGNMKEAVMGGVTVDRCQECHGIWFDRGEAERLKGKWMSEVIDVGSPKVGRQKNRIRDVNCPRCLEQGIERPMLKLNDDRQRHIEFEACLDHGQFFDAGEFVDYKYETLVDLVRDLVYDVRTFRARRSAA
jgi:uncharacterized protein